MHFHDIKHRVIHQCWCSWKPKKTARNPELLVSNNKTILHVLHKISLGLEILILPFLPEKLPETCKADWFLASFWLLHHWRTTGYFKIHFSSADYNCPMKADKAALTLARIKNLWGIAYSAPISALFFQCVCLSFVHHNLGKMIQIK